MANDLKQKIDNRMDHLQQLMESNTHLHRPEYVYDVIESVVKFWRALEEEDKEYIEMAKYALDEKKEWNV